MEVREIFKSCEIFKMTENQINQIENPDCPCYSTSCSRHGKCSECQAYHRADGSTTACGK